MKNFKSALQDLMGNAMLLWQRTCKHGPMVARPGGAVDAVARDVAVKDVMGNVGAEAASFQLVAYLDSHVKVS